MPRFRFPRPHLSRPHLSRPHLPRWRFGDWGAHRRAVRHARQTLATLESLDDSSLRDIGVPRSLLSRLGETECEERELVNRLGRWRHRLAAMRERSVERLMH